MAAPNTPEEEAIAKAASDLSGAAYQASDFSKVKTSKGGEPYRFYNFKANRGDTRPPFERPIRLKDVMFPLGEGQFVPASTGTWLNDFPAFSYVMDAVDSRTCCSARI